MSETIHKQLHKFLIGLVIAVQVMCYPAIAFAQSSDVPLAESEQQSQSVEDTPEDANEPESSSTSQEQTTATTESTQPVPPAPVAPAPPASTGPQRPTGAASSTYTLNPETGLWENDVYTWDPVTKQTKPKQAPEYSYNPSSGMWDTTEWYYSPEQGKYVANTISQPMNPLARQSQRSNTITGTGPNSTNQISNNGNTKIPQHLF